MPFDGTDQKPEIGILDRMRALLATPDRWVKGDYCNDNQSALCLYGAINKADNGNPLDDILSRSGDKVLAAFRDQTPGGDPVSTYNDHASTTHADILALIDAVREGFNNETTL